MGQLKQVVRVRGTREGLMVSLGDGPYAHVMRGLKEELAQKHSFLRGSHITLAVGDRQLRYEQLAEIRDLFEQHDLTLWTVLADTEAARATARELGLATRLSGSQTDLNGKVLARPERKPTVNASIQTTPDRSSDQASNTLLLQETLRSGRSVYHEGHVVVIGEVNPGAEIVASGHVIVWGRLRGLVHAGALGDTTAVICALELNPTQLRIADQIAIPPEERQVRSTPEQAAIRSGHIVAEAWSTRRSGA